MMKLYLSPTSPFARLILINALEQSIPLELCWTDPWARPDELLLLNPFATIPVLVTEQGNIIYESLLILSYLGMIDYKDASKLESLAFSKTLLESCVRLMILKRYTPDTSDVHPAYLSLEKLLVDQIRQLQPNQLSQPLKIGQIDLASMHIAVALLILELRYPDYFTLLNHEMYKALMVYKSWPSFKVTSPDVLAKFPTYEDLCTLLPKF